MLNKEPPFHNMNHIDSSARSITQIISNSINMNHRIQKINDFIISMFANFNFLIDH